MMQQVMENNGTKGSGLRIHKAASVPQEKWLEGSLSCRVKDLQGIESGDKTRNSP